MPSPNTSNTIDSRQVAVGGFDDFVRAHSLYSDSYKKLSATSRLLAISAQLVYELHPDELGPIANDILSFADQAYPFDYIGTYILRVEEMRRLQERFDANPSLSTLGDGSQIDPQVYGLSLLLSIVFTNHRFEIMHMLQIFLCQVLGNPEGRIASIGCGTGYELKLAAERLPGWEIVGYDIDAEMQSQAATLLSHFGIADSVTFADIFPLDMPSATFVNRYDAIILCEVLEHLHDPARALAAVKECLKDGGRLFVTMAINMAQEDHVFLYPDVESCRRQIRESGLRLVSEWLAPQSVRFPGPNREIGFTRGNYIAVLGK